MKFNLKNRPKPNHSIEDLEKRLEDHSFNVAEWFEGFEKELREKEQTARKFKTSICQEIKADFIKEILGE